MKNMFIDSRFDEDIFELIPHRPPMLLINRILTLGNSESSTLIHVDDKAPFFVEGKGVPAWIGIEYMGQTAALIAGYRLKKGLLPPHLGFLIGTRSYKAKSDYFQPNTTLRVTSTEEAIVAEGFAKFSCTIEQYNDSTSETELLATSSLSVYRRLMNEGDNNEQQ